MKYHCTIPKCPHPSGYVRFGPVTGENLRTYNKTWIAIEKSGILKLNSRRAFCPHHLQELYDWLLKKKKQ